MNNLGLRSKERGMGEVPEVIDQSKRPPQRDLLGLRSQQ